MWLDWIYDDGRKRVRLNHIFKVKYFCGFNLRMSWWHGYSDVEVSHHNLGIGSIYFIGILTATAKGWEIYILYGMTHFDLLSPNRKYVLEKTKDIDLPETKKIFSPLVSIRIFAWIPTFLQLFASIFPMLIFLISVNWIPPTKFHWWGYVKIKNQIPILTFIYENLIENKMRIFRRPFTSE